MTRTQPSMLLWTTTFVLVLLAFCRFVNGQEAATSVSVQIPVPEPTPTPIPSGSVRIEVKLRNGVESIPGQDTVVWLPGIPANMVAATKARVAQRDKQFEPRLAIVSVGSTIDFPNFDRVFHNVFSLSSPKSFDLGLYRKGKSKNVRFDDPGLVQIYCNIHPHMAAYLMIVDSAHRAVADGAGRATLPSVPAGNWSVEGWNVRAGFFSAEATVRSGRTSSIAVELDVTSWREVPHLNKHGKEYPPPDDDDFRY
ncbi:MAG: hypothetical protein GY906_32300 [bacterium]|nr:hypothetical protein [bacterium]